MQVYGNLTNRILEAATKGQPEPVVGMGATLTSYSDRHAGTITKVFHAAPKNALYVEVQEDTTIADPAKAPHAMGHQDWLSTPNANGSKSTFRWNDKTGRWDEVTWTQPGPAGVPNNNRGRWTINRSHGLTIGKKSHYYHWEF